METERDDVAAQDVLLRSARLQLGALWVTVRDPLRHDVERFGEDVMPRHAALIVGDWIARAGIPYHFLCRGPFRPSHNFIHDHIRLRLIEVYAFCWLLPIILPDAVTFLETLVDAVASVIVVDRAKVKLGEHRFFTMRSEFQGSLDILASPVLRRFATLYLRVLLSLVINSDLFLAGFVTILFWDPLRRSVSHLRP
eukprot:UN2707